MKSIVFKCRVAATVGLFVLGVLAPSMVSAQSVRAQEAIERNEERREPTQVNQDTNETMQTQRAERRSGMTGKLQDAKLEACEKRQETIMNIMERFSNRGEKQLEVFTKISERVQAFYTKKGYILENYDGLVADVAAKKAAAEVAVESLRETAHEFSCSGEDPKGVAAAFKEMIIAKNTAMKDYRQAVKDLIAGVKSVQPMESTDDTLEGSRG